uniref:Uncharacterized protein n=1 Tax=Rhizophora mucronata TaxID=61149 RepID=A0A2P2Q2G6_RHIMU
MFLQMTCSSHQLIYSLNFFCIL